MVGIKILKKIIGGRPGRKGQRRKLVHFPIKIYKRAKGQSNDSQNMGAGTNTSSHIPENLLGMQILQPCLRATKSETLE